MRDKRPRHRRQRLLAGGLILVFGFGVLGILSVERFLWPRPTAPVRRTPRQHELVEFDRFSARQERGSEGERLSVSIRLRTGLADSLECFVFVVARNDRVSPRLWSIWPPQATGPAISTGGHFHGANPASGYHLTLSEQWERVTATVPRPTGPDAFDTVVVYVLQADGRVLLARPFRV